MIKCGLIADEQTKEYVKDEIIYKIKDELWNMVEPYLDYQTEMTANGIRCTGKLNVDKEIQQYCVKTSSGYSMEPFNILVVKPFIK